MDSVVSRLHMLYPGTAKHSMTSVKLIMKALEAERVGKNTRWIVAGLLSINGYPEASKYLDPKVKEITHDARTFRNIMRRDELKAISTAVRAINKNIISTTQLRQIETILWEELSKGVKSGVLAMDPDSLCAAYGMMKQHPEDMGYSYVIRAMETLKSLQESEVPAGALIYAEGEVRRSVMAMNDSSIKRGLEATLGIQANRGPFSS
ncbi:putative protein S8A [Pilchard orthomyxovirus]|uniref:Uncharacterized protein n=1 Tax=Pilchard orthomyxovirus TaxID=2732827 RepID=A0A6M4AK32_9ORTO|nr:putative protein S8A [Pilchard orthomyxovirus]QJQ28588.1 putative protein S8A [Pilchard orthomyxovirus]QJQ28598.1 putative protein S8A [Pilchard orthomyxovirus]QJQ28608.1 putative protein S8A [Pilchard orthomyxovirus]QJQ28618.1 putative protein S8A [Pilchard orthomyxovirus]QJQ28628.1 putative protein S8A [Pilchard orthomyxovirus]